MSEMVLTLDQLNERWVNPYYLHFLHANFLHLAPVPRSLFVSSLQSDLAAIDPATVERLLRLGWREQMTGSWFAGLNGWSQFRGMIGEALLLSRSNYVGQGYCFALAHFAGEDSVEYLRLYLDEFLPRKECEYDQAWALGALMWLDDKHKTNYAQDYIQPGGLWDGHTQDKLKYGNWTPEAVADRFHGVMQFSRDEIEPKANPALGVRCNKLLQISRYFLTLREQRLTLPYQGKS